ncbi:MAG TPA: EAL domain-containing protein [Longimicrobiaceae bacterium]|jgi:diguanylate cyclase (GGDEF)-like protein/PAS domain S-box-containing protein
MAEILQLHPARGGPPPPPRRSAATDLRDAPERPRTIPALRIVRAEAPRDPERARLLRALEGEDAAGDATLARQAALAARALDAAFALVSLADGERHVVLAESGLPLAWAAEREWPAGWGICPLAAEEGGELALEDVRRSRRAREARAARELGVLAYAAVPLRAPCGTTVGCLCAMDTRARPWSGEELELLEGAAAGVQAELARRLAEAERGRAAAALAEREAYHRALLEHTLELILVVDGGGRVRSITPSAARALGFTPEELVGRSALARVHPDDRRHVGATLYTQMGGGRPLEYRVRHRDGSWRLFEGIGRDLRHDPAVGGIVVNARDVTERRRVEEEILHLAAFPRNSPSPILECGPDGAPVYLNPAAERLLRELGLAEPAGFLPPAHADLVRACLEHGEGSRDVEVRVGARVLAWTYQPDLPAETVHLFAEEVTERKRVEERLLHDALHDSLTGLPNRLFFMERLGQAMARARRSGEQSYAVLFMDLDRFKLVNDSLGHPAGDELLGGVARRLRGCLRPSDTVARFGGDEFAVLLEDLKGPAGATRVAERIQGSVAAPFTLGGHEVFTGASIGIALPSGLEDTPEELLQNADTAMYRAKASRDSRYEVFDWGMHAELLERLQTEMGLRRAVERGEFVLHYQPIVSLRTGRIAGFEALLRWDRPEHGLVSPGEFMEVAEETGLILPIGRWVLGEACRRLRAWQDEFPGTPLSVSVNLSVRQLRQEGLAEEVRSALEAAGVDPRSLKLEITESVIMEKAGAAAESLDALRALGVQLHMDDFGTGYSSLSYLHRLPLHAVKVDRSFVGRMDSDFRTGQLVRTIVPLAHTLGLAVIAEGVETPSALGILRGLRCEYAQGYHFSLPLEAEGVRALLATDPRW